MNIWISLLVFFHSSSWALPPVLRVSLPEEPASLQWRLTESRLWAGFVMRGLTRVQSDGQVVCDLCTQFTSDQDQNLTLEWNKEVKWQDGVRLAPEHFRAAVARLAPPGALKFSPLPAPRTGFVIAPKQATPGFSTTALRKFSKPEFFPSRDDAPDGTLGPYQVVAWEKGKRLVLEANEFWPFPETRPVYRLEFYFGTPAELFQLYERGKIDIMSYPTTDQLAALSKQSSHHVQSSPQWAVQALVFRMHSKLASKTKALREHLLTLLSNEDLLAQVKTGDRPAVNLIPPGLSGAREGAWKHNRPDFGCAEVVVKRLRVVKESGASQAIADWVMVRLQEFTRRCSIKLQTLRLERPQVTPSQMTPHDTVDLVVAHWRFDDGDALPMLTQFHSRNSDSTGFSNSGFDALSDLALKEKDRASALIQLDQMLEQQEAWVRPLVHPMSHFLVGPRVIGFAITPRGEPDFSKIQLKDVSRTP